MLVSYSSTLVLLDTKKYGMEFSVQNNKEEMEYAKVKGLEGDAAEGNSESRKNIASDEIPFWKYMPK